MMKPDPIFALIEEHRTAQRRLNEARGPVDANELVDAEMDILEKLNVTKPTSIAGCAALADYLCGYDGFEDQSGPHGPMQALATIAAALDDLARGR